MSISTLIGLFAGMIIILAAMMQGPGIGIFINVPGLLIVVGGTITATMIRYSMTDTLTAFKTTGQVIKGSKELSDINELIDITDDLLQTSRKQGMLALENYELNNVFYKSGVSMLVNGYSLEMTKESLIEKNRLMKENAETASGVFSAIGDAAPAFGMIGTLVGLIQMLSDLSDPDAIGPAMAVALLTTLYGAMIANLIALPIADKIDSWAKNESYCQVMIIEAIDCIGNARTPSVTRELLAPFSKSEKKEEPSG